MNKERRKRLENLIEEIETAQSVLLDAVDNFKANIDAVTNELTSIRDDEEDAFSNMPESLQQGDKGQASEAATDKMNEAEGVMDDATDDIIEAINDKVTELLELLREAAE